MAAARKIQGPYQFMSEDVQDELNRGCWREECRGRAFEQAPSASVEATSARPQLRPRAAALVQRLRVCIIFAKWTEHGAKYENPAEHFASKYNSELVIGVHGALGSLCGGSATARARVRRVRERRRGLPALQAWARLRGRRIRLRVCESQGV